MDDLQEKKRKEIKKVYGAGEENTLVLDNAFQRGSSHRFLV